MGNHHTTSTLQETVNLVNQCLTDGYTPLGHGTPGKAAIAEAARRANVPDGTFRNRLRAAERVGLAPDWALYQNTTPSPTAGLSADAVDQRRLQDEVRRLRTELSMVHRDELTRAKVREWIGDLTAAAIEPPKWLIREKTKHGVLGVPSLFWSDLHLGENVDPNVINGSNAYNLTIAEQRVHWMVERALMLLFQCLNSPKYDGIVLPIGGDMVSGEIHEELVRTNDAPILPILIDLIGLGEWVIDRLLEHFEYVFIPCEAGNHGRLPHLKKVPAKQRNHLNFDWLFYVMLHKIYAGNKRVSFLIPDGPNAHFRIYRHRYCLSHGEEFRGGDGMIGPLGPITRGTHKKLTGQTSIGLPFDTMLIGHFHSLMMLPHLIVNGSPKGYDEYAASLNIRWERPAQALWITHPDRGITFSMPVYLDDPAKTQPQPWVSWAKEAASK